MSDDVDVKQVEKGDSSEDRMNDLLDIIKNADPNKLKALMTLTSSSDQIKPKQSYQHGPVKTFTTVIKNSTCLLCGTVTSTIIELGKGERLHCTDASGNIHSLTSTGKVGELKVASIVSKCYHCDEVIRQWTPDELVKNFIRVKKCLTWKEVADYSKIVEDEG